MTSRKEDVSVRSAQFIALLASKDELIHHFKAMQSK
jgi:hypothetical protein